MEFMFGDFFSSLSEIEVERLNSKHSKQEQMFNMYIRDIYKESDDSKKVQYNLYVTYVLPFERVFDKPCYNFTIEQVKEVMGSIPSNSINISLNLYSLLKQYTSYSIHLGYCSMNIYETLNKEELIQVNSKALKQKLISTDDFWKFMHEVESRVGHKQWLAPFLLAYLGVVGSNFIMQLNLCYDDISDDDLTTIDDKGNIVVVPIDRKSREFFREMEEETDNSKVIPSNDKYYIYNEMQSITRRCPDIKLFKLNDLYKNRIMRDILDIREHRKVRTIDFQNIILKYNPSSSKGRFSSLVKWYEAITDDKVLASRSEKVDLSDANAKEFVAELRKKLNYY